MHFKETKPAEANAEARDREKRHHLWRESVGYSKVRESDIPSWRTGADQKDLLVVWDQLLSLDDTVIGIYIHT